MPRSPSDGAKTDTNRYDKNGKEHIWQTDTITRTDIATHTRLRRWRRRQPSWLDSLSGEQRDKATYEYMDGERVFWYYPPLNRHGLALRDMDDNQRKLAYGIMESGLTERAYKQASQIIDLETTLGKVEKDAGIVSFRRDPELYYFTVFGDPRDSENPWAWRVEGHHVSLHYSIWGDKVISTTPFFFGSNPAEVLAGPDKGQRILGDREDLALELVNGLSSEQQRRAVIYPEAPYDILTYNSSRAVFPQEEGSARLADERHAARDDDVHHQRVCLHNPRRRGAGQDVRRAGTGA